MRPFQVFRVWARRAPLNQKVGAAVATLIVVALVGWLLVPDDKDSSDNVTTFGNTTETTLSSGAPGAPGGPGDTSSLGSTSGGSSGSGGTAAAAGTGGPGTTLAGQTATTVAGGCQAPPSKAQGVTDKEIKVAVILTEIGTGAANSMFGIDPPDVVRKDTQVVIDAVNKEGGAGCRKIVPSYFTVNPINEQGMMQTCRDMADAKVFAVLDSGSLATKPAVLACVGQSKIVYIGGFYIAGSLREQFYPYLYSFYYRQQVYRDTVFALKERGFFDPAKGFKKLGWLYRDCEEQEVNDFRNYLKEAGISGDKVVEYSVGCPAVFALGPQHQQAVQNFKNAGVTHVTTANTTTDIVDFQKEAVGQSFKPVYGMPDEALQQVATGSRAPDPNAMADAILITLSRDGEHTTPGMKPTAGTQKCDAIRKAAGLEPTWKKASGAGHACDLVWMMQAMANNAPELSAAGMQVGLQRSKSIDFAFPQGQNDFSGPKVTTGGQFWRVVQYKLACKCWQVVQPDFRRGFGF
jgi:hypothetical protein